MLSDLCAWKVALISFLCFQTPGMLEPFPEVPVRKPLLTPSPGQPPRPNRNCNPSDGMFYLAPQPRHYYYNLYRMDKDTEDQCTEQSAQARGHRPGWSGSLFMVTAIGLDISLDPVLFDANILAIAQVLLEDMERGAKRS